jgi:hypothetical protein
LRKFFAPAPVASAFLTAALMSPVSVTGVAAQMAALSGDAIKETVAGKTVDLDTPLGSPITVTYKENGSLSGTAGTALGVYLGASSDRGRWWVDNGRLCQKFFKWLEGETNCLRLKQDGQRIAWTRDDGKTGTATITANGPVRAQTGYGLGGGNLAQPTVAQKATPPSLAAIASGAVALAPAVEPSELTPAIEPPTPRPVLASLTSPAMLAPPHPTPVTRPAGMTAALAVSQDWFGRDVAATPGAQLRALVTQARQAHIQHRWCHLIREVRFFQSPQALQTGALQTGAPQTGAPELLTAARHLQAQDSRDMPAASCLVPVPALQTVARQLAETR